MNFNGFLDDDSPGGGAYNNHHFSFSAASTMLGTNSISPPPSLIPNSLHFSSHGLSLGLTNVENNGEISRTVSNGGTRKSSREDVAESRSESDNNNNAEAVSGDDLETPRKTKKRYHRHNQMKE